MGELVVRRILAALSNNSHVRQFCLQVMTTEESVTVMGKVRSFHQKQVIGSVVSKLADGLEVFNQVEVDSALQPTNRGVALVHGKNPLSSET